MAKIETLGVEAKDSITGLTGILTAKATYITGCDQYLVQPQGDGTKYPEASWVDEGRLSLTSVEVKIKEEDVYAEKNGCDISAPMK